MFTILKIARTGFYPKDLWGFCVSDGAAQMVEVIVSVELGVLLMHNGDKVGASAAGELIRKKMKVAVNPFP